VIKTFVSLACLATMFLLVGLPAGSAQEASHKDVTGRWRVMRVAKDGEQQTSTLDLKQRGPDVTGTYIGPDGETATIKDGKVVNTSLTFSFLFASRDLKVSCQIVGDKMDLTIASRGTKETFHAVAERLETSH
jgi:hypothetical protein